jgi:hypothetical protein
VEKYHFRLLALARFIFTQALQLMEKLIFLVK